MRRATRSCHVAQSQRRRAQDNHNHDEDEDGGGGGRARLRGGHIDAAARALVVERLLEPRRQRVEVKPVPRREQRGAPPVR